MWFCKGGLGGHLFLLFLFFLKIFLLSSVSLLGRSFVHYFDTGQHVAMKPAVRSRLLLVDCFREDCYRCGKIATAFEAKQCFQASEQSELKDIDKEWLRAQSLDLV